MKKQILKRTFLLLIVSLALVSCGKSNKSGTSSSTTTPGTVTGGISGGNGTALPNDWLNIVFNENRCRHGDGSRRTHSEPLRNMSVNAGGLYVGATSNGDVMVVSNKNNIPTIDIYVCNRPGLAGGGIQSNPVINYSSSCSVGEITSATMILRGSNGGSATEAFRSIHIPNAGITSSLCR